MMIFLHSHMSHQEIVFDMAESKAVSTYAKFYDK